MSNSDVFVTFGGDTGALEAAMHVVKSQMAALSTEMRRAATEFNRTGQSAESELGKKIKGLGVELAHAKDAMDGLKKHAKDSGDAIKNLAEKVGNAAYEYGPWTGVHVQLAQAMGVGLATAAREAGAAVGVLGAALGVTAIAAGASIAIIGAQTASLRKLDDAARATRISMTALKNLNTAGAGVGVDADQMNQEMSEFAKKLREAQVAGGDLADFLKANSIAIKDAHGNLLPVQQVFGKIAELILTSTNEMDRLAALSKAGFSSDTLRLIERQTDAVKTFASSAESAQDEVLKRGLADGEALSAAWQSTWTSIKEAALSMSVSVLSSIGEIEHQGAAKFDELANRAHAAFARIIGDAQGAAKAAAAAFSAQRNEMMREEAMSVAGGKSPFGGLDTNAFGPRATPKPASDAPTIKGLYDDDKGGGKSKSPKADRSEENAEMKGLEDSIKAAQTAEKAKESLLSEGVRLHLLSEEEKVAGTKRALDEEYSAEKTLLQKELQINGLKLEQKQAINDKLKALDAKYLSESTKAVADAVSQQAKTWESMVDTMSSSMSSGISGMIQGTTNFKTAMLNLEKSVVNSFVQMGVNMVADWAKKQITMTILSQTAEGQKTAAAIAGATARTGVAGTESAAVSATTLAAVLKSISASAAETFAGVFGFLSPVMGPGAAAPAAAAMATVSSVAAFDIGAYNLDRTQLALVHKNEMVMPAAEAGAFRSMLSGAANGSGSGSSKATTGGDSHVHLNVTATDAASVKSWFSGNSRQIMKALNTAVQQGNHLGLRRLAGT